jgi:hypothetical protein
MLNDNLQPLQFTRAHGMERELKDLCFIAMIAAFLVAATLTIAPAAAQAGHR